MCQPTSDSYANDSQLQSHNFEPSRTKGVRACKLIMGVKPEKLYEIGHLFK